MGLVPLVWFKDGLLITGGDFPIPLDPVGTFKSYLHIWFPYVYGGVPNTQQFMLIPWFGFWAFFKALGFSLLTVNKLWFIFIYITTGLSMYYLVSVVFNKEKFQVIALIASIFYMFNVYIMLVTLLLAAPLLYAGLPLILGLYIKGLKAEKSSTKYSVLIGIASLLLVSGIYNPPAYAICGIILFSYLIYCLVIGGKRGITRSLIFTLKTVVTFILINFWWIYPYIGDVLMGKSSSIKELMQPSPGGSPFYETFRLFGSWAFFTSNLAGTAYFPFAHYYQTPFFVILTCLIPILAFLALPILVYRRRHKLIPFFLVMAIIGVWLAHGAYPSLLGSVFLFIYRHVPGFWIFREPFAKFTTITAVCYAVLIGFSTDYFYRLIILKNSSKTYYFLARAFVVCILLIMLTSAWPILTGDHIFTQRGEMKSHHVAVPDYWFEAGKWFNNQEGDFKILVLPHNPPQYYCGLSYKWGYGSCDISPYLIHQPLIEERSGWDTYQSNYGPFPPSQKLMQLVYRYINGDSEAIDLKAILGLMNVRYILQRNDVDWKLIPYSGYSPYSPEHIKSILDAQKGIHLEKTFGQLDIYKIDDEYFVPHIYTPKQITYYSDEAKDLSNMASFNYYGQDASAFIDIEPNEPLFNKTKRVYIFLDTELSTKSKNNDGEDDILFTVPKEGPYEVLFKLVNQSKEIKDFKSAELEIDGKRVDMVGQGTDGDNRWFLFGRMNLTQGNHKLRVDIPTTGLQISNYEKNEFWTSGIADTSNFKEGDQGRKITSANGQMVISDRTGVNYDLRKCDYIDIWVYVDNINNLETAHISFGNVLNYNDQYYKYFQDSITSNGWNHLQIPKSVFNSASSMSSWDKIISLRIGIRSKLNTYVNLTFDNLSCRSGRNIIAFRSEDSEEFIKTPDIYFTQINPARYVVNVQNATEPFFLVFSESYHPRWKAFIGGEEVGQHFTVNGYANTWHISKTGTYEITLDFQGKRMVLYGVAVSLVSLLLFILYLIKVNPVQWVKKKHN